MKGIRPWRSAHRDGGRICPSQRCLLKRRSASLMSSMVRSVSVRMTRPAAIAVEDIEGVGRARNDDKGRRPITAIPRKACGFPSIAMKERRLWVKRSGGDAGAQGPNRAVRCPTERAMPVQEPRCRRNRGNWDSRPGNSSSAKRRGSYYSPAGRTADP